MTGTDRIIPKPLVLQAADEESQSVWGFRDTAFSIKDGGVVQLSGDRYELSGQELPELLGWVQDTIHPDVGSDNLNPSNYPPAIPEARTHSVFVDEVRGFLNEDQFSDDAETRLRHGHGHTQEEMYGKIGRAHV